MRCSAVTPAELLEAWRVVARDQDATALRSWTLEHAVALASAVGVTPDKLHHALQWTSDEDLAIQVEAQAVYSLVRLEMNERAD